MNRKPIIGYKHILILLLLLLLALIIVNILFGVVAISPIDLLGLPRNHENALIKQLVLYVRLPRTLACIFSGIAFSCAGLVLQIIMDNPLASPGVIGVNSGAGLFVVFTALLLPGNIFARSLGAFIGAFLTIMLVYMLACIGGASRHTIVLSGVALSSLFSSFIEVISNMRTTILVDKASFAIGGFASISMESIRMSIPLIIAAMVFLVLSSGSLDMYRLGDDVSRSLGMNTSMWKFIWFVLIAVLSSSAVAMSGLLGFLGLIVPHLVRALTKREKSRELLVLTALAGADLTLLCDFLARMLFKPYEIPVGIIMSVLGVPFFLVLLLRKGREKKC